MSKASRRARLLKKSKPQNSINRLIDANLNRSLEGMRVCEEYCRFIIENRSLTSAIKKIRHDLIKTIKACDLTNLDLISARDTIGDIGKKTIPSERKRKNIKHIALINFQRAKEALRVLEEYLKIYLDTESIKSIRYKFYEIEKRVIQSS